MPNRRALFARGVFIPRARGAVLAGVGPACCALAGPRRNLRFVKSEWLRRRGLSLLIPGDAAGFSVVCTNRPLAASSTSHAVFRRAHGMRTQFSRSSRRPGGILRRLYKSASAASGTSHAVSGQRAACEPSFAHPTMESPQKSLARDEPEYLCLARARG